MDWRKILDVPKEQGMLEAALNAANRGVVAGLVGGPVDTITTLLRPLGYSVEAPVGGSEWIGQQMERAGMLSPQRSPMLELAASILRPSPKLDALAKLPTIQGALTAGMLGASMPTQAARSDWIAYHGSPHKFAAERLVQMPDGSKQYIVGTPDRLPDIPVGARLIEDFPLGRMRLDKIGTGEGAQSYGYGGYTADKPAVAIDYAEKLAALKDASPADQITALLGITPVPKGGGYLYRVDIDDIRAPKEAFLDWDKPLSQQSESVQAAANRWWQEYSEIYRKHGITPPTRMPSTGKELYQAIGDKKLAASFLRDAGIPGIRYLDAGSRASGGTYNTVLFDDSLVKILGVNEPGLFSK